MLAEKIREHDARVWLVNTGWSGGPYGVGESCGSRIGLKCQSNTHSHALLDIAYRPQAFGIFQPTKWLKCSSLKKLVLQEPGVIGMRDFAIAIIPGGEGAGTAGVLPFGFRG
ncbi:uncharacterized protein METZ01_LOCUS399135 [marine metagenome]|uniref:Phosphoenolpyruvate carboxykinase (ATP) n=1 Tax=marine metagenome TaxID=408172 RepID=A0A382VK64_9ZZZZ